MTATQRGRTARNRGNQFERDVAAHLTSVWRVTVVTTRSIRNGLQATIGGDLARQLDVDRYERPLGWTIECKDRAGSSVPTWLAQAQKSAPDNRVAVIVKERNRPLIDSKVWMPPAEWRLVVSGALTPESPRWLPLDAWAALADYRHMTIGGTS